MVSKIRMKYSIRGGQGTRVGEITERWIVHDIALVKLDPSIRFDNTSYFQAKPPKRLLRASEVTQGRWYAADGMSTGIVYFIARGVRSIVPPRPIPFPEIEYYSYIEEHALMQGIFQGIGPTGGGAADGLCGAPIVDDDLDCGGGVAGFFQPSDGCFCFTPVLDELIDRGWTIA
ncbi:MAG: hypothetical protein M1840_004927 [Geoglossum simile]|nr:MAG: hypothetical protein M1840_004927 [Geoglossum simile]